MNLSCKMRGGSWVKLDLNTCAKWTTQEVALPEQINAFLLPSCVCNSQPREQAHFWHSQGHREPFPVTVNVKDSREKTIPAASPVAITCRTLPIVKCREGFNKWKQRLYNGFFIHFHTCTIWQIQSEFTWGYLRIIHNQLVLLYHYSWWPTV